MPKGVYKHKLGQGFQKGHKNLFGFQKGHKPFYFGGGAKVGHEVSETTRRKIAQKRIGMKVSEETREILKESHRTDSYLEKMSGKNNPRWKGGITSEYQKIRHCMETKLWRTAVFIRDKYTCRKCNNRMSGNFNAHHILNFSSYIKLRFVVDNGITFCRNCHKEFHKKYTIRNNTQEQIEEFLK